MKEFKNQGEILSYIQAATDEILDFVMRAEEKRMDPRQVKMVVSQGLNKVFHRGAKHGIDVHAEKVLENTSETNLSVIRQAAEVLSDLLEWQEGNEQPREEEPTWIRKARLALNATSVVLAAQEAK